jgi:hypothetical protein
MKFTPRHGLALLGLVLVSGVASAQPVKDAQPAKDAQPTKDAQPAKDAPAATEKPAATPNSGNILVEKTGSGQKLFRITEGLVVEGQRQKPNAFYVLQRASAPYDWETLEENFLPRILKAAEKPPF